MKTLWQYTLKYKYQFFCRIITISLVALASICFDFLMGFIVDIFASGDSDKFLIITISSISLIIVMFLTEYIDGLVMSSYIKNTVNYKTAGEHNEYRKKDNTDHYSTINIDSINISVI